MLKKIAQNKVLICVHIMFHNIGIPFRIAFLTAELSVTDCSNNISVGI